MASNTTIGNVTKLDLITNDNIGNIYYTYLNKNGLKINNNATYANVDTATRNLVNLMTNIFNNVALITDKKYYNQADSPNAGDVNQLLMYTKDQEENQYQTLINVGTTRVNPEIRTQTIYQTIMYNVASLSSNTFEEIHGITTVMLNEQMAE